MAILNNLRREASRVLPLLLRSFAITAKLLKVESRRETSLVPKRVLILAKVSRYEFEKLREPRLNAREIEAKLLEKGTDCEAILENHRKNEAAVDLTCETLRKLNIDYKITDRLKLDRSNFDWADMIFVIGGDGTFLLGANLIYDNDKPIIGINSDPAMSEGYLMLPPNYSDNVDTIFERLREGKFRYLMRSRIRVTLRGVGIRCAPFHMHERGRVLGRENYKPYYAERDSLENDAREHGMIESSLSDRPGDRTLPWLALNEVFIGESLSARTSSFNIKINEGPNFHKVKSSGLCVSTGTGSSSWYKAINSITCQTIREVLKAASLEKTYEDKEIEEICTKFNDGLQFSADDERLSYAIRDIIINDIWPLPKSITPRDFCTSLTIQSQCYDAALVLDGGIGVPFNVGTTAHLMINSSDALRTIILEE